MTGPVKGNLPAEAAGERFAERLRERMLERRVSVAQLAEMTGISERLIRRYRSTGKASSRPVDYFGDATANAFALAEALDCTIESLGLRARPEGVAA